MVCTFFGHRDTPQGVESMLKKALIDMIENKNVDLFYVGNQGRFDTMVRKNLMRLKEDYPHISYAVVLAYMPGEKDPNGDAEDFSTIYPDGLESTPPKFAINKRNRWMVEQSDYVVTYVKRTFGGAAQFKALAEKKGKYVINLAGS